MGITMKTQTLSSSLQPIGFTFVGIPIFLFFTGDFPERTLLKDGISLMTILGFSLMLAEFFLTRCNRWVLQGCSIRTVRKLHKVVGYTVIPAILIHPFLLVVPRNYEAGVNSMDAFVTIITAFGSPGVVFGICGWFVLLLLGVTSFLRKRLGLTYTTWRAIHAFLAALFILLATCHAIILGRHSTQLVSTCMAIGAACSILLLLKTYISWPGEKQEVAQ